jgi:hypothetical protein
MVLYISNCGRSLSAVFCLSLADGRKTEDLMDKENNPAPENDPRYKGQEDT